MAKAALAEHRIPPCAIEVEKHIIGGILLGDPSAYSVFDHLKGSEFYLDQHRVIYEALRASFLLGEGSGSLDLVSLSESLRQSGKLDAAGGEAYLFEISAEVVSAANIEQHAQIIKEKAERRKLIRDSAHINECAWNESIPLTDVRVAAEARLLDDGADASSGLVSAKDALRSTVSLIEKTLRGEVQGLQTQFYKFNEESGGLFSPDLIILAGRPATGKTALALDLSDYLATDVRKSVAFFSLEMAKEQLLQRLICRRQGIDFQALRTGRLPRSEYPKIAAAVGELASSKLFIDESPDHTPGSILSKCRRHKSKHGLDLVIVDNLSIMEGDKGTENRLQEVSSMTRALKKMGKRLECPIIVIVHLSRGIEGRGEDAIPRLSDLRECGSIEQDADCVYVLHRPDQYGTRVDIHALKQRNGPSNCVIPLTAEFVYQRFKSYEPAAGFVPASPH